jgi:drug/metabolite transporter (DMT)-like permease
MGLLFNGSPIYIGRVTFVVTPIFGTNMKFQSEQRIGVFLVILAALCFSTLSPLIKYQYAIDPALDPMNVITWRFIFAVPMIWALAWLNRAPEAERARLPRRKLLGVGMLFAPNPLLAFYALAIIPVSTYSLVFYSYPAIIVFVSTLFLGERLSRNGWAALGLTLLGLALTVPDVVGGLAGGNLLGILMTLGNIAAYCLYFLVYSRVQRGQTAMFEASAWTMTGTLLVLGAIALTQGFMFPSNLNSWLSLTAMGATGTVIPLTALFAGVKKIGTARAAIFGTIEPVGTLILAFLLLGERLEPLQWFGGSLVLIGVVLLQTTGSAKSKPNAEKSVEYELEQERA